MAEQLGIVSEVDVQAIFRNKMGKEIPPYHILGACNPKLADRVISVEPNAGALLPCNVVVQEAEGGALVSFADPKAMFEIVEDAPIEEVAGEARRLLQAARDQL